MSRDHEQYEENVGAYLLGALTELEAEVFERHVASCASCRQDFEHMRVASEALPRAVEPVVPPASLKKSLMEIVNAEARERERVARSRTWRDRLRLPQLRPAFALGMAAVLAVGVAIGIGVAGIGGSSSKTVAAVVDHGRLPMGEREPGGERRPLQGRRAQARGHAPAGAEPGLRGLGPPRRPVRRRPARCSA